MKGLKKQSPGKEKKNMLVGQTVKATLKDESLKGAYPWEGATVPVKIIGEYPKFFVGTVLPHRNPNGYGESKPYNITIDKHDIKSGRIKIS